tara:strand:+ start:39110 stop:40069 length:960 start_codon:yes stop_codon:yes gene_type:complete
VPEDKSIFHFSRARTALKYGLQALDLKEGQEILIPDFICDSIFQPIIQNSLNYRTYNLNDSLRPDWDSLNYLVSENTKAILMVHYFGQPQDTTKFIKFANNNNLFLIEDNAHGHKGLLDGKELGTFGHIGISSPRKFLNIVDGGKLYLNDTKKPLGDLVLESSPDPKSPKKISLYLDNYPKLKNKLRVLLKVRPKYEDPFAFQESFSEDLLLNKNILKIIESSDWEKIAFKRRKKFIYYRDLAVEKGLMPVYEEPHFESNPWCFAAYTADEKERNYWFDWGWRNNVSIFSWPTLRPDQIIADNIAYKRWKRLVCFSTYD